MQITRYQSEKKIHQSIVVIEERLLNAFPNDFCHHDSQGWQITKQHIERYLRGHRDHNVELISQVLQWAPGRQIAEVGVAYGATLLCLRDVFGYEVHGYELPSNIPAYCEGLQAERIPIEGWDLYEGNPPIPEGAFDMMICSEVVEHLYVNLSTVLERIRPYLRIGGRLLLTTPNIYSLARVMWVLRGRNICEEHGSVPRYEKGLVVDARQHPREYTFAEVKSAFEAPQWRLCKIWPYGAFSKRSIRQLALQLILKWILPYPVNKVLFAVGERTS
jgi:SAM-dependent methyltransferase